MSHESHGGMGIIGGEEWSLDYSTIYVTTMSVNPFSDEAEAKINSLVHGQSILPGILAPIFKKPVQMVSRFGSDVVQILRSRQSGPILATYH